MLQIKSVSDLRNKFPDIEKIVNAGELVYLTKNGYGAMVVLSLEEYSKLTDGVEAALDKADRLALESDARMNHEKVFGQLIQCSFSALDETCIILTVSLFKRQYKHTERIIMKFTYCPHCGRELIQKEIGDEGVIPYCENCKTPMWDMFTTSIICAVVNEENEIALLRQNYVSTTNYVCVAGVMKLGESAEETVVREVKEEIGLDVEKVEYIKSYPYGKKDMLMLGFCAFAKKKELVLSGEVDGARWFPFAEAMGALRDGSIAWQLVWAVLKAQQIEPLLRKLIARQKPLYEKVVSGDFSEVCYQEQYGEQEGTYDGNYTNRLRLAYYMFYGHQEKESLVVSLFKEELKDRENNSFQGIGSTLELLTALLGKYNQGGKYDALFERAGNANFDCACGYTRNMQIDPDINTWDIHDAIEGAIDMWELDIAGELVQIWQGSVSEWDSRQIAKLISYNKDIVLEERNEGLLEKSLAMVREKGNNKEIISAWHDLIRHQVQFGKWDKAYQNLMQLRQHTKLEEIERMDLFNFILERCAEIISNYPQKAQALWDWCKPYLQQKEDNLSRNLYKKGIDAANAVGDSYALELGKKYQRWQKKRLI